jgi:hypothetical protein
MHVCPPRLRCRPILLGVKLDDELLLNRHGNILPYRQSLDGTTIGILLKLKPLGNTTTDDRLDGIIDGSDLPALLTELDHVAGLYLDRGDIDLAAIKSEMGVPDKLSSLITGSCEAKSINHVIEPTLKQEQKVLTRNPFPALRLFEITTKLSFQQAVDATDLLLLAELDAVVGNLGAPLTMLTGRIVPPFDGTLVRIATLSLKVELCIFSSAKPARRPSIPSQ